MRVLIIDDESLARDLIREFLKDEEDVEVVGECFDGFEGFKDINAKKPDLVFLDVMMPKLTGFEMLELLEDPPIIIFSTAHNEFAIKAFEENAVDYLLKPYNRERFKEAVQKARLKLGNQKGNQGYENLLQAKEDSPELINRIAVKTGQNIHIIGLKEVRYFEAMDDYVQIHTVNGKYLKQQTMKYYEGHLPENEFVRIHRSYIVQVKEVKRLEPMGKDTHVVILKDSIQLPVSRSGYGRLRKVLGI
jgi:two-component system LytT family response regulator